jgi:hypothetical protein
MKNKKYLSKKCKICGTSFGFHKMLGDNCPHKNRNIKWRKTTFKE